MIRKNRKGREWFGGKRRLTLERLETRELMAADLFQIGKAALFNPLTNTSTSTPTSAVAASLARSSASTATTASLTPANDLSTTNRQTPPLSPASLSALLRVEARSYDGTGNNRVNPQWGSTDEQLLRIAAANYADGISTPAGADRPSAREISNALVDQDEAAAPNERQLSAYIYAWGQFIDHDLDLTEPPTAGREAFNVSVPTGDPEFDPAGTGTQTIALNRSRFDAATGTSESNPRQQVNEITSYLDGSMIYGSDAATAASLRTMSGGKLKTSAGNLPPTDAAGNYLAGDTRANENVELTSIHALFIREHNQWAEKIVRTNSRLSDEQIYQAARKLVVAEIQAITFNEFLPALLGRGAVDRYAGYNAQVNPGIANEFSTAAFRLGHSLINDDVEFFGNDGRAVRDEVELAEAFFNPALLASSGADSILKYLASTQAQELDNQIVGSLRNFLFGQPGQGGLDLASLNIQRGRDHGLADYNTTREAYGLPRVTSFAEITSNVDLQQKLQTVYGTVDNIDLWVGALAENHAPGGSVGPLVQTIVAEQFQRLRDGDRLWYQNAFSGQLLSQINDTTLADVIRRNTTATNLQSNVFVMKAEVSGRVFADNNGDGGVGRNEQGLAGVVVELLDDEGEVIATTRTNLRGSYTFNQFAETGDFQVRVTVPNGQQATSAATKSVLISRGGVTLSSLDFGLKRIIRRVL